MSNTTTTTTPKGAKNAAKKPSGNSIAQQIQGIIGSGTGGFAPTGTTSTNTPGVTSKLAGDLVPFTLPHQVPWFQVPSGSTVTDSSGGSQVSYNTWVGLIHQIKDNPTLLERVQRSLKQAGYLTKTWANYGTLDKQTMTAWQNMGQAAIGGTDSATSLLNAGMTAGNLNTVLGSIQDKINTAQMGADAVSSVNVSLTDPNEVAQRYATAMESMGLGAPSQQQVQQFVHGFINGPQGEIAAAQNQSQTQKKNYLAGVGDLTTALKDATQGNLQGANAAETMTGPTFVATKSMPNLDAESMASAKAANPGMYYATGTTYLYGLIQRALAGGLQVPTSPTSPSSQAPGGAIVTAPLSGAA